MSFLVLMLTGEWTTNMVPGRCHRYAACDYAHAISFPLHRLLLASMPTLITPPSWVIAFLVSAECASPDDAGRH